MNTLEEILAPYFLAFVTERARGQRYLCAAGTLVPRSCFLTVPLQQRLLRNGWLLGAGRGTVCGKQGVRLRGQLGTPTSHTRDNVRTEPNRGCRVLERTGHTDV